MYFNRSGKLFVNAICQIAMTSELFSTENHFNLESNILELRCYAANLFSHFISTFF